MDLKDIKAIIDLMKKNSISEFELERQDFKIKLKRGPNGVAQTIAYEDVPTMLPQGHMAASVGSGAALPATTAKPATPEMEITSPIIGTFYRAPSPESGPYVEVGSAVEPDTVVCIIEAMKLMNEIKAETKGVITEILVENARPVEYGQPLFKIRPA